MKDHDIEKCTPDCFDEKDGITIPAKVRPFMTALPEWIGLTEVDNYYENMQLREALAIAWEALEKAHPQCVDKTGWCEVREAMRRISDLGREKV